MPYFRDDEKAKEIITLVRQIRSFSKGLESDIDIKDLSGELASLAVEIRMKPDYSLEDLIKSATYWVQDICTGLEKFSIEKEGLNYDEYSNNGLKEAILGQGVGNEIFHKVQSVTDELKKILENASLEEVRISLTSLMKWVMEAVLAGLTPKKDTPK